ncbi:MAG: transcriptional activator RfaH [Proteobacteria bacterium]|nr:transcriptional activator RfaH [Pseudomonadota bacterium]
MDLLKKWFILQVKPNSHRLAERNLNRQGFESFLPLHKISKHKYNRYIEDLRPLFPGYMFVAFDPESGSWRQINSTIGVSKLISFGDQPSQIPLDLISGLMARCSSDGKLLPPNQLNKGDAVKLLTSPFANYIAKVETIDPDQRVWVLMELMGRVTRISVDPNQLLTVK